MKKTILHNILLGVLACVLFVAPLTLQAADESEETFGITFKQEYVVPGETLEVEVSGVDEDYTITWTFDNKEQTALRNQTSYHVQDGDLQKLIKVTLSNGSEEMTIQKLISKLPVVYIDIKNGEEITTKEPYRDAVITIQSNDVYKDMGTQYSGKTEIKGRGNSTWGLPKKPYRLKFDKKSNVFGMGKSKHWVLLANYYDTSLLRNTLAYNLSGEMGLTYTATVHVDVVINGSKRGNYQLCEHIRVDEDRVPVFDWEGFGEDVAAEIADVEGLDDDTLGDLEEYLVENMGYITAGSFVFNGVTYKLEDYDIEVPDISGGYAIELDEYYDEVSKFRSSLNQPLMFKGPEFVASNPDMVNWIKTYINAFEAAIQNDQDYTSLYQGEKVHYSDLFDMDALIDYWMVQELFFNEDAMKKSSYLYKEIGEKVKMGPIWDMDWSSACMGDVKHTDKWQTLYFRANAQGQQWYKFLVQDPYYLALAQVRYQEVRDLIEEMVREGGTIDQQQEYLAESGADNDKLWPRGSFTRDSETLQTWLKQRLDWFDAQFATKESFMKSIAGIETGNLNVTLTHSDGTPLAEYDYHDGMLKNGKGITITVAANEEVVLFVNGKEFATLAPNQPYTFTQEEIITLKDDTNVLTFASKVADQIDFSTSVSKTIINEDVYVESLEVSGDYQSEYVLGDKQFNPEGLVVKATMNTGDVLDVSQEVTMSGFDTINTGTVTLTLAYGGKETTIEITVKEPEVAYFEVSGITKYEVNDYFDGDEVVVKAIYVNDLEKDVSEEVQFEDKQFISSGEHEVAFTYKDYIDYVVVSVYNHQTLAEMIELAEKEVLKTELYHEASILDLEALIETTMNIYTHGTWNEVDDAIDILSKTLENMIIKIGNVENVKAQASDYKTITLSWDKANNAQSYNVYRKAYSSNTFKLVANVTDSSYISSGVMTGKEYQFKVAAVYGNREGKYSSIVACTTQLEGTPQLSIKKVGKSRFTLSWTSIDGATRYIVYRKRNDDKMKKVLTLGAKELTYTTAELPHGNYQFVLKAGRYDSVDRVMSDASNTVKGSVEKLVPSVQLSAATKAVKVTWSKVEGVTHYQVYRATSETGKYTKLITTTDTSYNDKALKTGKKYFYKVRGYKTYKSGADVKYIVYTDYSTIKSVTVK